MIMALVVLFFFPLFILAFVRCKFALCFTVVALPRRVKRKRGGQLGLYEEETITHDAAFPSERRRSL